MTPENLLNKSTQEKPPENLLNGSLVPFKIGDRIWVYQEGEGEKNQLLKMEEVTNRVVAVRNVKYICSKRGQLGSSLKIEKDSEGRLLLTASYSDGGEVFSFPAFYHIDQMSGIVVAFVKPVRGKTIPLLDLEKDAVVLIPLSRTKSREGGIIITTDRELKNPQNKIRLEGFLKII